MRRPELAPAGRPSTPAAAPPGAPGAAARWTGCRSAGAFTPGALLLLVVLGITGCATPAIDLAPERPDRPWQPATRADGEIVAGRPRPIVVAPGSYVLPPNPALGALPAAPRLDPERTYTLPELVDLAQSNNPATRIAWATARNAALAVGIAESAYLPQLSAHIVGGHQTSNGRSSVAGVTLTDDHTGSGAISALSLQWLLFDFGARSALVDAAQQVSVGSNIAYTAAHQRVIYQVCIAYYQRAAAAARLATTETSLRNALAVEAAADDRYRHGTGTVVEVAQARQATAQARLGRAQADGAVRDAQVALLVAVGVSPLAPLKVADVTQRPLSRELVAPVERIVADALARRPDVLASHAGQRASAARIRAAEAQFLPKLFVAASGAYNTGRLGITNLPTLGSQAPTLNLAGSSWSSTVFLGLNIPIYDGHTRESLLLQARADAAKADATFEQVRDEAIRQIVVAQNTLETSLAAYEAAAVLQAAAQLTFDAALDAYRQGVGSVTAASVAENQWLAARNAAVDAHSAALSAAAGLAFASGALGSVNSASAAVDGPR